MSLSATSIELLSARYPEGRIGCDIRYLTSTESTNKAVLNIPGAMAHHGLVVISGRQTAGRGRQGRSWHSEPDKGLYMTALLKPEPGNRLPVPLISLAAALALHDALTPLLPEPPSIKWPNDLLAGGKKLCGILGEITSPGGIIDRIALGLSVNIFHDREDFPEVFRDQATSLKLEMTVKPPEAAAVVRGVLDALNSWYDRLAGGEIRAITDEVTRRCPMAQGERISWQDDRERRQTGTTVGIQPDGTLQVRLDSGMEVSLTAGDVHMLR